MYLSLVEKSQKALTKLKVNVLVSHHRLLIILGINITRINAFYVHYSSRPKAAHWRLHCTKLLLLVCYTTQINKGKHLYTLQNGK